MSIHQADYHLGLNGWALRRATGLLLCEVSEGFLRDETRAVAASGKKVEPVFVQHYAEAQPTALHEKFLFLLKSIWQ